METTTEKERHWFRARRAALGMTQAAIAAALGVNVITVSRWERGVQRIPHAAVLAMDAMAATRNEEESQ